NRICIPQTFRNHPAQWELQRLLQALFKAPDPRQITRQVADFLRHHPLPADDFPLIPGTYTRSILLRAENRFEGMAARWSSKSVSAIHGHPSFTLYYVVSGHLACDNYTRRGSKVEKTSSTALTAGEFTAFTGPAGTFDNHIHQVRAVEDTLSIHVSSDDAAKGEIFLPEGTVQ
ncbi:MAG: hypothetical protein LC657_09855, partial [Desulfobacteraceae bacterium]|nr:hypothetical protein [Desulfobacteraceae bacterium]